MRAEPPATLTIAKFDKERHDRSAFACGFAPIDNFLKASLSAQLEAGMAAAWMATQGDDPAVLGFYTLGAMAVRPTLGPKSWQRAGVPDIPVIYLRALAVRQDQQGQGLGTALMIDALRRGLAIADQMGASAIVRDVLADARADRRWAFTTQLGFRPLGAPDNPNRAFLPVADARANLG